ncbi:methyltransferase [Undibacterium sp. Jales W-56]|uniref:class I SAM-dependent methyltransferase n=1 Tax=Undibacterium sp. Jales W-56 TaxID=2897325 RepID=UPI0021CF164F|nr:methyltransferase [Undibacterium sp. Jales W-56]MCU6433098.1 methyltransferase [Undibacterium sp. Jales W-56]
MNTMKSQSPQKLGRLIALGWMLFAAVQTSSLMAAETDQPLEKAISGSWRSDENRARDQFRHPKQTLEFFGVRADARVIEITPGGAAWYAEILAPLLKERGQYIAANASSNKASTGAIAYYNKIKAAQEKKFAADPERYSKVQVINFDPAAPQLGAANSADFVLTFRNVHNWVAGHSEANMFKAIFDVLKPGGVLGVIDHRAKAGKNLDMQLIDSGYLPEDYVISLAQQAGFTLLAKSEINANPKDTRDYPKGVWTLPPTYAEGAKDREKYAAIGESDRFTLRFVKPD